MPVLILFSFVLLYLVFFGREEMYKLTIVQACGDAIKIEAPKEPEICKEAKSWLK